MKTACISIGLLACLSLAGCASGGMFVAGHMTSVNLAEANYTIVARNVAGEAQAGYLIGVSLPTGMMTNTFALFRVSGSGQLYKDALEQLWKNVEAACGPLENRKLALINVRYDSDALNLLLYTQPRITIRADVVEFAGSGKHE